jgi:hypothetical protein
MMRNARHARPGASRRCPSPAMGVVSIVVMAAAGCFGDDATGPFPPTPLDAAYADALREADALEAELRASTWQEQTADGITGAFWLVARTRAIAPLVAALRSADRVAHLVLLREIDASLKQLARIRRSAAPSPALDALERETAALRGLLVSEIEPLLPAAAESDEALRVPFEISTSFLAFGDGLVPTDATPPMLVVGDLQTSGFCLDGQGVEASGLVVRIAEAATLLTVAEGSSGAAVSFDAPTWVTLSIVDSDGAFRDLASCELSMSGTRAGVAGTTISPVQRATLTQELDALEMQLDEHQDEVRSLIGSATGEGTLHILRELGNALDARRRLSLNIRWLASLDAPSADEKEVARKEHERSAEEMEEAMEEARQAAEDAKEQYQDALRILQEHNERETQVVGSLTNG